MAVLGISACSWCHGQHAACAPPKFYLWPGDEATSRRSIRPARERTVLSTCSWLTGIQCG